MVQLLRDQVRWKSLVHRVNTWHILVLLELQVRPTHRLHESLIRYLNMQFRIRHRDLIRAVVDQTLHCILLRVRLNVPQQLQMVLSQKFANQYVNGNREVRGWHVFWFQ